MLISSVAALSLPLMTDDRHIGPSILIRQAGAAIYAMTGNIWYLLTMSMNNNNWPNKINPSASSHIDGEMSLLIHRKHRPDIRHEGNVSHLQPLLLIRNIMLRSRGTPAAAATHILGVISFHDYHFTICFISLFHFSAQCLTFLNNEAIRVYFETLRI